jgi:hypothetical protein
MRHFAGDLLTCVGPFNAGPLEAGRRAMQSAGPNRTEVLLFDLHSTSSATRPRGCCVRYGCLSGGGREEKSRCPVRATGNSWEENALPKLGARLHRGTLTPAKQIASEKNFVINGRSSPLPRL